MNKDELIGFFTKKNFAIRKRKEYLIKNHYELYCDIINYEINSEDMSLIQMIYNYIYDLKEIPKCICGNNIKFNDTFNKGYRKHCTVKCAANTDERKSKTIETCLKKYDATHPNKNKKNMDKIINNNIAKYGVSNPMKLKQFKEKADKTNINKYGVKNVFQSSEIKEKIKETLIKKYNADNISKLEEFKEKKKQTSQKNYGVDYYSMTDKSRINFRTKFLKKIIGWNVEIYDLDKNIFTVKNGCKIHGDFQIRKDTLYNRYFVSKHDNMCTICSPPENRHNSNFQAEIKMFLIENNINFVENDRKIINPFEIDFFVFEKKIGIEINGSYYHSDFFKANDYHKIKTELADKCGIEIMHLWDFDYYENKNKVLSILRAKLGITKNKIHARNCEIRLVDDKSTKMFLLENHLQGWCVSKYRYGLYFRNELMSIMTFRNLRNNINNEEKAFELLRFCNKTNILIIGGASKLLKFFEKIHNPKKIISLVNRDISDGNLYKKLNFVDKNKTKPIYWWCKHMNKYSRFLFRKDILVKDGYNINKTEDEIMKERGYYKVYNSGNILFEKTFDL